MEKSEYDASKMAKSLLHAERHGVLSTISVDIAGYPFGSITPYAIDNKGELIIFISEIAQHTKNINSDSRVSITVTDSKRGDNVQAKGRITYIGDAKLVTDEHYDDISQRYLDAYPHAQGYLKAHGFNFYRIFLHKIRFIGGFGKIFWLTPQEFFASD